MITLSKSGSTVTFTFDENSGYLQNGTIDVPVNSLALITDESDMATFRKSASNDIFVSARYEEFGMSKAELEAWYKANMVGSTGGGGGGVTPEEVQGMIDEAVSGKQDTLVSGTNIKSINNESLLGSGNIDIQGGATYTAGNGINIDTANTISLGVAISAGTGTNSIIAGRSGNTATKPYSIALGSYNTASGDSSIAVNDYNVAGGQWSFAAGENTKSYGSASATFGNSTTARGDNSFAAGNNVETKNKYEFGCGHYNVSTSNGIEYPYSGQTLFSVGNGTSANAKHNAFEIRQNGDIYLSLNGQDVKLQDQLGGGVTPQEFSAYTAATESRLSEDEEVTAAGINAVNDKFGGLQLVKISQTDYDNLQVKDNNTLYIITD